MGTGKNLSDAAFRIRFAIANIKLNLRHIEGSLTDIRVKSVREETPEDEEIAQQVGYDSYKFVDIIPVC